MKKHAVTIAVVGVFLLLLALSGPKSGLGDWPDVLRIATATKGGTYHVLGRRLAQMLSEIPGRPIRRATDEPSAGSLENLERLCAGTADLALVQGLALRRADPATKDRVRVLAGLYNDLVQVVVAPDSGAGGLEDLRGSRIYVGKLGSGTRVIATEVLAAVGLPEGSYEVAAAECGYGAAAERLVSGGIEAAFFAAGTPTTAVSSALEGGCRLLDLGAAIERIRPSLATAVEAAIPAECYPGQPDPVRTVGFRVYLAGRRELDEELVILVLDTIFDRITDLFLAHTKAEDIHLQTAFEQGAEPVPLHLGARRFRKMEARKLAIATGTLAGRYHAIGKTIELLLEDEGIGARAIHTDGSLQNARLLTERPALAIMQYDAALASLWDNPRAVYKNDLEFLDEEGDPLHRPIPDLRRIVTLHSERLFVLASRDRVPGTFEREATIRLLEGKRVCVGPPRSGTRVVAEAVIELHQVTPEVRCFLSVPAMVRKLRAGEIDAGCFVGAIPREHIGGILADDRYRLLSVEPDVLKRLCSRSLRPATIQPEEFACARTDEPAVRTLGTTAVLVTLGDLPFDVGRITRTLFRGAGLLDFEEKQLAEHLPSLPLHPEAASVYRDLSYLPDPGMDFLEFSALSLTVLAILFGSYRGTLAFIREGVLRHLIGKILEVSSTDGEPNAVQKLSRIRTEARERARRRWWRPGSLNKGRWHTIEDLIESRIDESRSELLRSLLTKVNALGARVDSAAEIREARIRKRALWLTEKGELREEQLLVILQALEYRR